MSLFQSSTSKTLTFGPGKPSYQVHSQVGRAFDIDLADAHSSRFEGDSSMPFSEYMQCSIWQVIMLNTSHIHAIPFNMPSAKNVPDFLSENFFGSCVEYVICRNTKQL